ncbi:hypothetical protein AV530_012138 [Patagioenas fasciata monilis]|uniref:Uncharacterized protein n=1 Tax=Patagioenas fasciata monilis TaxID=372326 RepID=A0A1V4JV41_PATFA|nr:hypothetical protein AV530_012138 [Patagioenas fasciata monilis]
MSLQTLSEKARCIPSSHLCQYLNSKKRVFIKCPAYEKTTAFLVINLVCNIDLCKWEICKRPLHGLLQFTWHQWTRP